MAKDFYVTCSSSGLNGELLIKRIVTMGVGGAVVVGGVVSIRREIEERVNSGGRWKKEGGKG